MASVAIPPQGQTSDEIYAEASHVLPFAISWMIDNVLLWLLVFAEGYLMGALLERGWVDYIENPLGWGTYHGVGVVLFYGAGMAGGGLGLRASVAFVQFLNARKWGMAFFNFITVTFLTLFEIWSSFSERSTHLVNTPADIAVLHWFHFPAASGISPTLVIVSIALPFMSMSYGFSQQHKSRTSKADLVDDGVAMDRKIQKAAKQAELNKVRAAGARSTFLAARGKVEEQPEAPLL